MTEGGELVRDPVQSSVWHEEGTVDDPMSHEEVVEKALDLLGPVLGTARSRQVVETVAHLAELPDVRTLGALLSGS